jgi:glutamate decarboxylase
MPTFTLNFSRPGSQVIIQYYNLIRLGFEGYKRIHQACMDVTLHLKSLLERAELGELLIDDIKMPLLALKLKENAGFDVYQLSDKLRKYGWQVPAYTLAEDCEDVSILRVVVKEGFSYDLATLLVKNIMEAYEELDGKPKDKVINNASKSGKIC